MAICRFGKNESARHVEYYFPADGCTKGLSALEPAKMGTDLPVDVYTQWRKWCKNPTYFFADPEQQHLLEQYAQVKTPIYAVSALDDDWALPDSRHAFMQHYRDANMHYLNIEANDYGLKEIGHMGYFRQGAEAIWEDMLNTFDGYLSSPTTTER
jgi:predicted alpha/beta hydrolase